MEKSSYGNKLVREICSLTLLFICFFLFLSISSYSPSDPSFNVAASATRVKKLWWNSGCLFGRAFSGIVRQCGVVCSFFCFCGLVFVVFLSLLWSNGTGLLALSLFCCFF